MYNKLWTVVEYDKYTSLAGGNVKWIYFSNASSKLIDMDFFNTYYVQEDTVYQNGIIIQEHKYVRYILKDITYFLKKV